MQYLQRRGRAREQRANNSANVNDWSRKGEGGRSADWQTVGEICCGVLVVELWLRPVDFHVGRRSRFA